MKQTILLISKDIAVIKAVKESVDTATVQIVVSPTLVQDANWFANQLPSTLLTAVLLDGSERVAWCEWLRQQPETAVVPIIPIVHNAEERTAVFNAGATDTLLAPILPAELRHRLSSLTNSDNPISDLLLNALSYTREGFTFQQALEHHLTDFAQKSGAEQAELLLIEEKEEACIPTSNTNCIDIPLQTNERQNGALRLTYSEKSPPIRTESHQLPAFGMIIGRLLEISLYAEESESYATRIAFLILVAKMLAEQSTAEEILPLALEHAITLINANGGDIWLLSADEQWLRPVAEISTDFSRRQLTRVPAERGIRHWAMKQQRVIHVTSPDDFPQYDANFDGVLLENGRSFLVAPLFHQHPLGVIIIYHQGNSFDDQDFVLLEGICEFVSASLANAIHLAHLRTYGEQQKVLNEMSRQLASGLDLNETLRRAVDWAVRLCEVKASVLWLVDEDEEHMTAISTHHSPTQEPVTVPIVTCFAGEPLRTRKSIIANDLQSHPDYKQTFELKFGISPKQLMSVPMFYNNKPIGLICLLDKIGDSFTATDARLLLMAGEMIAISISNAQLHSKTIDLMDERARLYEHGIQSERLATVGRLTASLAHEINNPMQAIKGAMSLALEELDDSEAVTEYLELSMTQADRVATLVGRMRQIYQPRDDSAGIVDINHLIEETVTVARKEMRRQSVQLKTNLTDSLPPVWAAANQLHLVFLNITLNLSDSIGQRGGGKLYISSRLSEGMVQLDFKTAVSLLPIDTLRAVLDGNSTQEIGFGISFSRDIIRAHEGDLQFLAKGKIATLRITLPISRL